MSHDRGCYCGREKYEYDDCIRENCSRRSKPMKLDLDEEEDFGFTAISEEEVNQQDMQLKIEGLRNMIMPLLNNLKKNPEKEYIHWPNRIEKIDAFISKMNKYVDGK